MQIPFFIDVDGTLTDGTVSYPSMERRFHLRDGHGINMSWNRANLIPIIMSGEKDCSILDRCHKLGVTYYLGIKDKYNFIRNIDCTVYEGDFDLSNGYIAISDDTPDLELLRNATLAFCPADAHSEVLRLVNQHENGVILTKKGGDACVREAIDFILTQARVKNLFKGVLQIE